MTERTDEYDWLTTEDRFNGTQNQYPADWNVMLFERWVKEGWEIVTVAIVPPTCSHSSVTVIGVLKRKHRGAP